MDVRYLNTLPINQKAKEMLEQVGEKTTHHALYIIQLAKWGYEKGGIFVESSVCETVEAMFDWRPQRLVNFLMIDPSSICYDPPGWVDADNPLDLARIILDDIEHKILVHFPWASTL